jgi:PAS domain S-box-containing protein
MTAAPLHILLVEGSPADATSIQTTLRRHSFLVTAVARLSSALAVLHAACVDVILLDLTLPDSQGAETLRIVLEEAPGIAIVVLTGDDEEAALDAVAQGAQDCLFKGRVNEESLVRSIRYAFERNRVQHALRGSDKRFRGLIDTCSDGIALTDRQGKVLFCSSAVTRILGYSVDEFAGRSILTLIHPDDVASARERLEASVAHRSRPLPEMDLRYRHRDGTWRYLEVLTINRLDDPAVLGIVANFRDVTERHESLETADRFGRRYEVILNSIADGVHGLGPTGIITFENAAATAMLGWEGVALIGEPAHETVHHSRADGTRHDKEDCPILATVADGIVRHVSDDVFWRKDGTSFHVDYVAAPQRDNEGRVMGVVVAFRDITRQQEMQRQVDQAVRVSSLGRVAASVAHEFNNVLMGIQPFAEILSQEFGDDAVLQRPLRHIIDGVKRGRTISNQILRFASPAEPRLALLDLGEWTRHFGEEARLMLRDRKLEVETASSLIVTADSEQLSQVMINLTRNAHDASVAGTIIAIGAAPAATIPFLRERLPDPHRFAAVFVRDHGEGISSETLDHIFEPLFTTKKSGGTGIGLAVAHQIVSEHSGKILVESDPGAGSTFYVTLPLEEETIDPPEAGGETFIEFL